MNGNAIIQENQVYCGKCGNMIDRNNNFCGKCGQKIGIPVQGSYINSNYTNNSNNNKKEVSVLKKSFMYYGYFLAIEFIYAFIRVYLLKSPIFLILDMLVMLGIHKILMQELFRKSIVNPSNIQKLGKYLISDWWIVCILFMSGGLLVKIIVGILGHVYIKKLYAEEVKKNYQ